MNCGTVKKNDIANDADVRASPFVSGCAHHYPGCFNEEAWDFNLGRPFTRGMQEEILEVPALDCIEGLALPGGESFEPESQEVLVPLLGKVRARYPQKGLWCYIGYTLEQDLLKDGQARYEYTDRMLSMIDVLVDGWFMEAPRGISLPFRGPSSQHILNPRAALESGSIKLPELGNGRIWTFHGDVRRYPEYLLVLQSS